MEETNRSWKRSSSGSTLYLTRLLQEGGLHLLELVGILRGEIVGAGEVFRRVVQLPAVLAEGLRGFASHGSLCVTWRTSRPCRCHGSR